MKRVYHYTWRKGRMILGRGITDNLGETRRRKERARPGSRVTVDGPAVLMSRNIRNR